MEAYEALKMAIDMADENYRTNKDDSYFSVFYAHKKKRLEKVLSQVENRMCMGFLLRELKQERLRFVDLSKEEAAHPTFDWYGEHYWEIVYDGKAAGCEAAIGILESALDQRDIGDSDDTKSKKQ
ncbi:hypothetical protein D3Z38_10450 [Clostridiales bacterium]|nr:hypothetical protein [Clostridiales bacterium]